MVLHGTRIIGLTRMARQADTQVKPAGDRYGISGICPKVAPDPSDGRDMPQRYRRDGQGGYSAGQVHYGQRHLPPATDQDEGIQGGIGMGLNDIGIWAVAAVGGIAGAFAILAMVAHVV